MAHTLQEPYSGKNPVPRIATKLTSLVNPEKATEAKAQQIQDQRGPSEENLTKKRTKHLRKGRVVHVVDPTTGEEVDIKNADTSDEPDTRSTGENVLDMDFPPPNWDAHRSRVKLATDRSIPLIAFTYLICFTVAHFIRHPYFSFALATIPSSFLAYTLLFRLRNLARNDFDDRVWHSERMRGLKAGSDVDGDGKVSEEERIKESAEWANAVLRGVWPVMNPELFTSLIDMLEDIMQASVPSFIHSVRIADLGLGKTAARITSIRSLPDAETRERLKATRGQEANVFNERSEDVSNDTSGPNKDQEEELSGDHVNVELSFAYRGLPSGKSITSKAMNVHLLVEFFLGIRGVWGLKVPIWVEVTGAVGTGRARLQLISDPPFVKTTMVSLMGLPRITISVVPLNKILPNVMDIPFISGFISSAIDTAVAEYVAPKSLTIDLQQLISGDDVKKDTEALGILVVHIHRATGVKGMDLDGDSADPYITLTYSKLGKPLYSTRIIKGDRNPVYEETAFLMVDVNTIRLREKLSFQLWDSDRTSVDDMLGIAEIDVLDLVRNRGRPVRKISPLSSPDLSDRPGSVEYTVGYYGKLPPSSSSRPQTDGADPGIPSDLLKEPEFQKAEDNKAIALNDLEKTVLTTPPDPEWASGILSVQVHEVKDLNVMKEHRGVKMNLKAEEAGKGQDDSGEPEEEAEGLPSSYCEISLNDELVYKTRVKPITSYPMFNAGTERFVKDWRKAHVTIAVKDSRMRENDAILGVVMLKLSELLVNASELTRFYSLEEGLGYGRIRISILFRPIEAKLPPNLLGFDTGSLEIRDIIVKADSEIAEELVKCSLKLKASKSNGSSKVSRKTASRQEDGSLSWPADGVRPVPVRQRYGAALLLTFKDRSILTSSKKALGVLWLRDVVDNLEGIVEIPLWKAKDDDYSRLKLNYVSPDGNLDYWDSDKDKVERLGTIALNLVFKPGISEQHKKMLDGGGAKQKEAWDAFNRERAGGLRETVGIMEESDDQDNGKGKSHGSFEDVHSVDSGTTPTREHRHSSEGNVEAVNAEDEVNTLVQPEDAEEISPESGSISTDSGHGGESDDAISGSRSTSGKKGGLIGKLKEWKDNEKELHRDHRGMMQAKPVRTAIWLKDNVEEGAHAVKERFSMKERKPDVDTEV